MFHKRMKTVFLTTVTVLALALSACSNQSVPGTESTAPPETAARNTEKAETPSASAENTAEAPESSEAGTTAEGRVLTREELDAWTAWFHEDWYFPGGFLRSEYTDVRSVNFASLLYNGLAESVADNGPIYPEIGEDELAELIKIDQWAAELESYKIPKALLSEKLLQYTGLKFDDFSAFEPAASFFWLEQYDAYYVTHSDALDTRAKITGGTELPDGSIQLDWEIEVEPAKGTVTLQKLDDRYVITANSIH